MEKDFYLTERASAAYLEKDWIDHLAPEALRKGLLEFAPFPPEALYSDYHERLVDFLSAGLKKEQFEPRSLLEIGSSLGRTYFEVCKKIPSVQTAVLVEPSQRLHRLFSMIFSGAPRIPLPILKGNLHLQEVDFDFTQIRSGCSSVQMQLIHSTFQQLQTEKSDLVICSNVIDQCADHWQLAHLLRESVLPGGFLLLSCTYQWSDKYIGNAPVLLNDINELFDSNWKFCGETNLPFHVRIYERYFMHFISHVVLYRKSL